MAISGPGEDDSGETFVRTPSGAQPAPVARTDSLDPLVGTMLGEYRVLARLGAGGMGVVYEGEQPQLGKPVAIKVVQEALAADPQQVKKLLDEARAVCAVRHPNIADIFSFGVTPGGRQYFVMELLQGEPLDAWIREQGQVAPAAAIELLKQVLAALSAAHASGVIHRDLKPSNIFLARLADGTRFVKLLDFGLAKRTAPNSGGQSTSQFAVGTPLYMAPEQVQSGEIGPWTDLYAVGCLAYELLTGTVPFNGATLADLLAQHTHEVPQPLTRWAPGIPEALNALVLQLLEKDPARRPGSAALARRELERIERKLSVDPTRLTGLRLTKDGTRTQLTPSPEKSVPRPPAPGSRWAWLALSLLAAVGVGVGGAMLAARVAAPSVPLPPAPPVAGLVAPPPPPAPVRPILPAEVAPSPEPAPPPAAAEPEAPAAVPPKAKAVRPPHTAAELQARITRLIARARAELTGGTQRAVLDQLDEYARDPACARFPEGCWREINGVEKDNFR